MREVWSLQQTISMGRPATLDPTWEPMRLSVSVCAHVIWTKTVTVTGPTFLCSPRIGSRMLA